VAAQQRQVHHHHQQAQAGDRGGESPAREGLVRSGVFGVGVRGGLLAESGRQPTRAPVVGRRTEEEAAAMRFGGKKLPDTGTAWILR